MTDSLRDRIATVLLDHWPVPVFRTAKRDAYLERIADAVIAALTDPVRGCTDPWHWETGEPYRCPNCGYWMGEGYVK